MRIKKNVGFYVILIIVLGNLFRTNVLDNVRTVDVLQILGAGMMLGALIALTVRDWKDSRKAQ